MAHGQLEVLNRRMNGFTAVCVAKRLFHRILTVMLVATTVPLYHVMVEFCTIAAANDENVQVLPVTAVTPVAK